MVRGEAWACDYDEKGSAMTNLNKQLILTILVLFTSVLLPAQTAYDFRQLDYAGATDTYVGAINSNGVAVGRYNDSNGSHGFKWSAGVFTSIDCPRSSYPAGSQADGINDAGLIVGTCVRGSYDGDAFVLDQNGFTTFAFGGGQLTLA